ncbi:MAG TPA: amino acid permease [Terriglobia bacterium]|nr:amino acid permease [Terriglobia bacterium]
MPDSQRPAQPQLTRGLGSYATTAVVAGTVIGTGIFLVPSQMLAHTGSPAKVMGVWVFAGILSLFGALGYAELGGALPEAGGEYVYLREAYGPGMGFVYGWSQFLVAKAASIATLATGFLLYTSYFFPSLNQVLWRVPPGPGAHTFSLTGTQIGAVLIIFLLSGFNVLGVRRSGALQTVFTAAKLSVLVVLIVAGIALGHGSFEHFRGAVPAAAGTSGFLLATVSALWAYDGWNNLSMVAAEVQNPRRNMPRALIIGMLIVLGVYLLANVSYFYVLTPGEALATTTIATTAARRFLGSGGGTFVAVGVLISTFAALNGSVLSGSRIPYAQAHDGLLPMRLARVHPRFRTPAVAIMAQAVVAGIFALTGAYEALYTKAIYSEWIFYALCTAAILILRRRRPDLARPYRTWGYPLVPLIFVTVAVLILGDTLVQRPADALWCIGLTASGIPAYFLWKAWRARTGNDKSIPVAARAQR